MQDEFCIKFGLFSYYLGKEYYIGGLNYLQVQSVINDINLNMDFTPEESVQKIFQEYAVAT